METSSDSPTTANSICKTRRSRLCSSAEIIGLGSTRRRRLGLERRSALITGIAIIVNGSMGLINEPRRSGRGERLSGKGRGGRGCSKGRSRIFLVNIRRRRSNFIDAGLILFLIFDCGLILFYRSFFFALFEHWKKKKNLPKYFPILFLFTQIAFQNQCPKHKLKKPINKHSKINSN